MTGDPAGYNADDVTFANHTITHRQQAIYMSTLVPDRSTDARVREFASVCARSLQEDVETAKVLLVQWNENPDIKRVDDPHGSTLKGMIDTATITTLNSSHGSNFDTLWLQSMISGHEGAIEMANDEVTNGTDASAIDLAKRIINAQQVEVTEMKQLLAG